MVKEKITIEFEGEAIAYSIHKLMEVFDTKKTKKLHIDIETNREEESKF